MKWLVIIAQILGAAARLFGGRKQGKCPRADKAGKEKPPNE